MLVRVDSSIDDIAKQVAHEVAQSFRCDHAVQGTHKDGLVGLKALRGLEHVVAISQNPGDDLDLFGPHPARGDLVEVVTIAEVVGAGLEQGAHRLLYIKQQIHITILARPFNLEMSILVEGRLKSRLSDVPGDTPKENLAGVHRVLVVPRGQMTAPCAAGLTHSSSVPV